jgi:hypothetical protein
MQRSAQLCREATRSGILLRHMLLLLALTLTACAQPVPEQPTPADILPPANPPIATVGAITPTEAGKPAAPTTSPESQTVAPTQAASATLAASPTSETIPTIALTVVTAVPPTIAATVAPPTPTISPAASLVGPEWTIGNLGDANQDGLLDVIAYKPAQVAPRQPSPDYPIVASEVVIVQQGSGARRIFGRGTARRPDAQDRAGHICAAEHHSAERHR